MKGSRSELGLKINDGGVECSARFLTAASRPTGTSRKRFISLSTKHSRHVGFALRDSPQGIPWWRCVNGTGTISVKDRLGVAAQAQQPEIVDGAVGVAEMGELEDAHAKSASAAQPEPKSAALIQRESLQAEGHKFIGKQLLEFNKARLRHHF